MAGEEKNGKPFKGWRYFIPQSIAGLKSQKRLQAGVCIGCGKNPCECKRPASLAEFNHELGRRLASLDSSKHVKPAEARDRLKRKSEQRRKSKP